MGTREAGASHQADVAQVAAEGEQPFNGGGGTAHERADQFRIVLPVTALHRVVEGDFNGVLRALGSLKSRTGSIETARSADGVAAHHGHLFNDHNLGTEVRRFDSSRKAGTARADHGDVNGDVFCGLNATESGCNSRSDQNLFHECSPL